VTNLKHCEWDQIWPDEAVFYEDFFGIRLGQRMDWIWSSETENLVPITFSLLPDRELSEQFKKYYKRYFQGNTVCSKCKKQSDEAILRLLSKGSTSTREERLYIVCDCGHPVWKITYTNLITIEHRRNDAARHRKRHRSLKEAGGTHSTEEIQAIQALQNNRCIYCDIQFSDKIRPSLDHLLPAINGGTNWHTNIVLACKRCNSSRCAIPFRTYCRFLSPEQNIKILFHLHRRIMALDIDNLPTGAFRAFLEGLDHVKVGRLSNEVGEARRKNWKLNKLLPSDPSLIIKMADKYLEKLAEITTEPKFSRKLAKAKHNDRRKSIREAQLSAYHSL
jgi:hypothetical protein